MKRDVTLVLDAVDLGAIDVLEDGIAPAMVVSDCDGGGGGTITDPPPPPSCTPGDAGCDTIPG